MILFLLSGIDKRTSLKELRYYKYIFTLNMSSLIYNSKVYMLKYYTKQDVDVQKQQNVSPISKKIPLFTNEFDKKKTKI